MLSRLNLQNLFSFFTRNSYIFLLNNFLFSCTISSRFINDSSNSHIIKELFMTQRIEQSNMKTLCVITLCVHVFR